MQNQIFTKIFCISCIIALLCFICTGCIVTQKINEDEIYRKAIEDFFTALDDSDKDAIYDMFSPAVQEKDSDLAEEIDRLIEVYPGPTEICANDGLLAGEYSTEYWQSTSSVYNIFPVISNEKYYWCLFELMYENDADESQIGITRVLFYTADEYCILEYDENAILPNTIGLSVFADNNLDCEIRAIESHPYKYTATDKFLNISDIQAFFNISDNYSDFVKAFGEPNAINIFHCYELAPENGQPRYLQIGVDDKNSIYGAYIVDDLEYLDTIWEKDY